MVIRENPYQRLRGLGGSACPLHRVRVGMSLGLGYYRVYDVRSIWEVPREV